MKYVMFGSLKIEVCR